MADEWTFPTNHGLVLLAVADHPDATLRQISDTVGITERAVQRIVSDLVAEGYLVRVREGRRNRYEIHYDQPMRHDLNHHDRIGDLLRLHHHAR